MFSNTTPLNWHSTLRRLRKEGDMGQLGRDMGVLPGRKTFSSQLQGMVTKHKPSYMISEAAAPAAKRVNKVHKINKKLQSEVKKARASASDAPTSTSTAINTPANVAANAAANAATTAALQNIPPGPGTSHTPSSTPLSTEVKADIKRILEASTVQGKGKNELKRAMNVLAGGSYPKTPIKSQATEEAERLLNTSGVSWYTAKSHSSVGGASSAASKHTTHFASTNHSAPSTTIQSATAALLSPTQASAVSNRRSIVRTPGVKTIRSAPKPVPKSRRKKSVEPIAPPIFPETPSPAPEKRASRPRKVKQAPIEVEPIAQPVFTTPTIRRGLGVGPGTRGRARRAPVKAVQPQPSPIKVEEPIKAEEPPKAPSPPPNSDPLKRLQWPGTVKLAKSKGLSEEKIAEITGQAVHERGNTPTRTKKLKAFLRSM